MDAQAPPHHPDKISSGYTTYLIVASVFTLLCLVCVIIRFCHRRMIREVWWDDWAILASLMTAFGLLVTAALVATVGRAGYHVQTYDMPELEAYIKITLANDVLYNFSLLLSKASILLFYTRIFSVDKRLVRIMMVLGVIMTASCLAAIFGLIFANSPVEGQWNLAIASTSIDGKPFWVSMGIINLFLDIAILAIPQSKVWKLHLSRQNKLAVSLVFLLGGFVCVTTVVRVIYMARIDVGDFTYAFTIPGIWTVVEMDASIICACLPVVYSFFKTRNRPSVHGGFSPYAGTKLVNSGESESAQGGFSRCQVGAEPDNFGSRSAGPIHVERAYAVTTEQ